MTISICRFLLMMLICNLALLSADARKEASGKATVYSSRYEGKRTASGMRYNRHALTAASPYFPLGSKVLVENTSNGHSVVVKINDREAAGGGRIIDLSSAAAKSLGVNGSANVRTRIISNGQK